MTPSVHNLAAILQGFDCAMLTVIDAEGRPRTRPMTPLKAPFNGHLWFHVGADGEPASEIGRGSDVSVAYGATGSGPYVTVYGWAIVLRNPPYVRSVWRAAGEGRRQPLALSAQLICVTARAAEVWDAASTASRRVFAFSNAHPLCEVECGPAHETAAAPRRAVRALVSCSTQ
jgi:general stress protein 26